MIPGQAKFAGGIVCAFFSIIGTVLNSVSMLVLLRDPKLRSHPTTILVIALSGFDLLYTSIIFPLLAVHYLDCWFCFSGSTLCSILAYAFLWNHGNLLNIQAVLAVNRWAAVCTNMRITCQTSLYSILISCVVSTLILIVPSLGIWGNFSFDSVSETCSLWSTPGEINPNTVLMPFALGVPYTIIFACYAVILKTIRKNNRKIEQQGSCNLRPRPSILPELESSIQEPVSHINQPNTLSLPNREDTSVVLQSTQKHSEQELVSTSTIQVRSQQTVKNVHSYTFFGTLRKKKVGHLPDIPEIVETEVNSRKSSESRSDNYSNCFHSLKSLKEILQEEISSSNSEEILTSSLKSILVNTRPDSLESISSLDKQITSVNTMRNLSTNQENRISYVEDLERKNTLKKRKRNRQELNLTFTVGFILITNLAFNLPGVVIRSIDPLALHYPQAHIPIYVIAWSSTLIHPLVYVACNPSYRAAFKRSFLHLDIHNTNCKKFW
ncbi:uncharacterized protein LOC111707909 [Eurytemora carolleeae]|uniref:uncharacterized protein LOC111707909 n=1 Tax=Eurytemora carolleeae TaxID=1294199 RepID=UPI000C79457D|nr:uncharacterized protein LOC111707909 [Eurytemora carolleeae]|eukprot:XP_023336863.1 uncharacterized protein LOC111707909 [Eurytemora affinis]